MIKEWHPVRIATKRIQQILDVEYKKINLKSIIMNLNCLKIKHKNLLLELFQKYDKLLDGTLGKYIGSVEPNEDAKPYHAKPFSLP